MIPFTKITMFPYFEQVQDIEHYGTSVGDDLDSKQANEKVFTNYWYIEHYGASFGDDIMLKITISNISHGYSMNIDY